MKKQKYHKSSWWEHNKKKVFVVGGLLIISGVCYMTFKNRDAIISLVKHNKVVVTNANNPEIDKMSKLTETIVTNNVDAKLPINNGLPFKVSGGIRNLPDGHHPSLEKLAQAAMLGITLGDNQTLVDSYFKNAA